MDYGRIEGQVQTELAEVFGDRLTLSPGILEQHGRDESYHPVRAPDAVAFPRSTDEVAQAMRICNRHRVPIVPFGAGTSLEGHISAVHGGLCIDFAEMNEVLSVSAEDMDATVQPGVRRRQLNEYLRDTGLFFSVDPGADASIGGMASTRASGTNAVRYGTMREVVMGLTVVLADGRVIETGGRSRKSAAGYDLTRLLVGAEGTLGVITSLTVRLFPQPEQILSAVVTFDNMGDAVTSVIETMQMGVQVARIEFVDEVQIDAINRYSKLNLGLKPTLFLEFHGSEDVTREQIGIVTEICEGNGGGDFEWASQLEDRNRLWRARHDAAYAALAVRPGCRAVVTDICVPISQLSECILEARRLIDASPLTGMNVGHAGDGNFHSVLLVDPEDKGEVETAKKVNAQLVELALSKGGTCTGEHGIGLGKREFLAQEVGEGVDVMRDIKTALDPLNILNPGKIM